MATNSSQTQSKSFFRRFLDGFWRIIRLLIAVILVIILGTSIYYGGKSIYLSVLSPLNDTINRVEELEQAIQTERDGMTAQLTQRDERITELESQLTKQKGQLTTQQNALNDQQEELEAFATLNSDIEALDQTLQGVASDLEPMQNELTDLQTQLTEVVSRTDGLDDASKRDVKAQNALDERMNQLQEVASDTTVTLDRLHQERLLLHAQANILNAQRSLTRRDIGIANEYLQRADISLKAVNQALEGSSNKSEQAAMAIVLTRLDQTIDRLESDPFSATTDLQGVWRALDSVILADLPLDQPQPTELSSDSEQTDDAAGEQQADEAEADDGEP